MGGAKILGAAELLRVRERLRSEGKTVGFTNGCFDLLHAGHARYLREARGLVDALIVAVNEDASVRLLKGEGRPILPTADRAELLAALEAVDYVVPFPERTAERLVGMLRPDVYVKGGDYAHDTTRLPEAAVVRAYGGEVRLLDFHEGRSTSELIRRIQAGG
jgi:rfaE bifunctional protein nucleotidyltransferase chain/domain